MPPELLLTPVRCWEQSEQTPLRVSPELHCREHDTLAPSWVPRQGSPAGRPGQAPPEPLQTQPRLRERGSATSEAGTDLRQDRLHSRDRPCGNGRSAGWWDPPLRQGT